MRISKESIDKFFPKVDVDILGYESPIEVFMGQIRMEQENNIVKVVQEQGVNVDKDELIKALKYDRDQYEKGYINGYLARNTDLYDALESVIWYDGHYKWLKELCGELEKAKADDRFYDNPFEPEEWHTEQHVIWMLLVGMFGDWGTSIRSGWIEKHDECIAFINRIIKPEDDENGT